MNEWSEGSVPLVKESLGWKGVRDYTSVEGIRIVSLRAQVLYLGNQSL